MISRRTFLQCSAAGLFARPLYAGEATSRVALVIGNNHYRDAPLASARNDAEAMSGLLKQAGFAVDLRLDATRTAMVEAVGAFGRAIASPAVQFVVFYYAGHAAQQDWRNYLLPIDADVAAAGDVRKACVDLSLVLGALARARGKTALIILDACRDDPFGARYRPPQKGLSQYDAPAGTLLAFATAPGGVAAEISGRANGLYTEHLLRELAVRGARIEDAFKRVRLNVRLASGGRQIPWESTSLEGEVMLFAAPKPSGAEIEARLREELAAWERLKNVQNAEPWVDYLRRYPDGRFAEVGQVRLSRLLAVAENRRDIRPATAALELGPDLAVPARFQKPANPYSAGTYLFRPTWTVGDEYTFDYLDLYSGVAQRRMRIVVRKVDTAADRVELSNGSILDLLGNPIRNEGRTFEPPIQLHPAELQVGRRWLTRFEQSGKVAGAGEYSARILAREDVTVPAGKFHAFKLEASGWFNPAAAPRTDGIRLTRWLVPGINVPLRVERFQFKDIRVLIAAKQRVST